MPGEFDFIDFVRSLQTPSELVRVPAGDDLAVLKWPGDESLLVGVDQVLDGVHFQLGTHSPADIGRKVVNRNLSDCAAMGCLPAAALVSLAMPKNLPIDFARELYEGMKDAADKFGCAIVGGDTATWPGKLAVSVTILGRSAGMTPVLRSGAKVGHHLYVTGPLGGSILGRHMTFEPRVQFGRYAAGRGLASAMIDLSDGLSRDLAHLCRESNVAAVVYPDAVPIHEDVYRMPPSELTPLEHALHDGEDYELLIAAEPYAFDGRFTRIGEIVAGEGAWLVKDGLRVPLAANAWEHPIG